MEIEEKISLRKANIGDLTAIRDLVIKLAIFEREPEAVTATLEQYEDCFKDRLIEIILAEEDKNILGMALYYEAFSTWKGKMLYLEDFIVLKEHRNRGIGALLFDAFMARAKKNPAPWLSGRFWTGIRPPLIFI